MSDGGTALVQAANLVASGVVSGAVSAAGAGAAVYAVTKGVRWVLSAIPHPFTGLRMVENDRPGAFGRRWQLLHRIERDADARGNRGRSVRAGMAKQRLTDRTQFHLGVAAPARRHRGGRI